MGYVNGIARARRVPRPVPGLPILRKGPARPIPVGVVGAPRALTPPKKIGGYRVAATTPRGVMIARPRGRLRPVAPVMLNGYGDYDELGLSLKGIGKGIKKLGKGIEKKVTRPIGKGVKKLAKSPLGKVALVAAGGLAIAKAPTILRAAKAVGGKAIGGVKSVGRGVGHVLHPGSAKKTVKVAAAALPIAPALVRGKKAKAIAGAAGTFAPETPTPLLVTPEDGSPSIPSVPSTDNPSVLMSVADTAKSVAQNAESRADSFANAARDIAATAEAVGAATGRGSRVDEFLRGFAKKSRAAADTASRARDVADTAERAAANVAAQQQGLPLPYPGDDSAQPSTLSSLASNPIVWAGAAGVALLLLSSKGKRSSSRRRR